MWACLEVLYMSDRRFIVEGRQASVLLEVS